MKQTPIPFMLQLLEAAAEKLPRKRSSPRDAAVRRDHGLDGAELLLAEGLRRLGLSAEELPGLKKGDPRKAALAAHIRARTAVPNQWIAQRLCLGHVSRVNHCASKAPPRLVGVLSSMPASGARL